MLYSTRNNRYRIDMELRCYKFIDAIVFKGNLDRRRKSKNLFLLAQRCCRRCL